MPIHIMLGGKVTGDDLFDRDDLIDQLWGRLPRQSVELVAPRRFGKTSVMQRLADQPRHGCQVRFIDCEAFGNPNVFTSALADTLLDKGRAARARHEADHAVDGIRGFMGRARRVEFGLGKVSVDLSDPLSAGWSSSIESLLNSARQLRAPVAVILDEFSMMLENFARAKIDASIIVNFLTWFRRLRLDQGNSPFLAFVVGGSMNLEYWLRRLNATATMNDLHRVELPPFDQQVAEAFVEALMQSERLQWMFGVPDTILE